MKILLQHKIFIGYFLLMAIIGSMVAIVLHERGRVQKIEDESIAIFQTQHNINTTHRYVTTLVTYGESVMVWNDEDSLAYRERRVRTDSMLQTLRIQCKDFIQPEQIDSLRTLLAAKEDHLFQIMEATRDNRPDRYPKEERYRRILRWQRNRTDAGCYNQANRTG